ncbi:DUF1788 domain-containing protein [Latilactobacillus curvatus]|uniref:DUF1788 domain-containing protein n=2 Tax=Latilactobacillus curvatus TaxID=28038 RepID=A0AAJ5URR2_LATCU|nr:DUF1788 domain-containing protein [Latilactobacillus curvatus]AOO75259.1 hypothetical protein LCW_03900 [Latilactobacillus curvatus]AZP96648.1 DUF1788 domain-containing protein [Latilactobacillus curvatus]KRK91248.1 L-cystine import ATP-binding protein [Latilactobacillus curvatus JCM 1096 = DSM 20019]MBZ1504463.1 DUF1788 domain-containing protein [Latilactobacillus curvatus]MCT3530262.1 DUF1788 domain-containing protein [Latilactobacillus curvatus]
MDKNIEDRFKVLEQTLNSDDFLKSRGLGNEVGYYIFDYNPRDELVVREYVRNLKNQNAPETNGYTLQVFNLYEIMMEFIEQKGYLSKIVQMEQKHGIKFVASRINRLLKMEEFDDAQMYFTKYIGERVVDDAVVILTGIGEIYPIIRAHSVLNKMHLVYTKRPVIMMYPGEYDRLRLTILDTNRDANYYRAFRIN